MQKSRGSFTGRTRRHRNRWMVRLSDVVARWFITVGGIGTIVAVLLVFAFLLSVVLPLFWPAAQLAPHAAVALQDAKRGEDRNEASPRDERRTDERSKSERPAPAALLSGVNEYRTAAWALDSRGRFVVFLPDTGELVRDSSLWDDGEATSATWDSTRGRIAIGMQDGQVRLGKVASTTEFVGAEEAIPESVRDLKPGRYAAVDGRIYEATSQGSLRKHDLQLEIGEPLKVADAAITTLDLLAKDDEDSLSSRGPLLAVGAVDGHASVHSTKQNAATGELRLDESTRLATTPTASKVVRVLLTSAADNACVVWQDGSLDRFDIRDFSQPRRVERVSLVANQPSAATTAT
ncbi:MAG TPA: hypothetical protein PLV92_14415, partial [Pirellulaceae bacterium]|nr:hypothetical protein [Pirellulaceae bacterium]